MSVGLVAFGFDLFPFCEYYLDALWVVELFLPGGLDTFRQSVQPHDYECALCGA